jgi:transcriptional regulator with XRE-family HTH domain
MSKNECSGKLEKLGQALRKYRKDNGGLTQEKMAALLGIGFGVYAKIELGYREAGSKTLPKMFRYFQDVRDYEMVLALLVYSGVNVDLLEKMLNLAGWNQFPDTQPANFQTVSVLFEICNTIARARAYYHTNGKWLLDRAELNNVVYISEIPEIEGVYAWRYDYDDDLPLPSDQEVDIDATAQMAESIVGFCTKCGGSEVGEDSLLTDNNHDGYFNRHG